MSTTTKMIFITVLVSAFICNGVFGGEILIAKSPPSVQFQGEDPIDQRLLPDLFSAALGFTTQRELNWQGMSILDPFNFAKALVVLHVDGIPTLGKTGNLKKYLLHNDEDDYITWKLLKQKIINRYPTENNTIVNLDLSSTIISDNEISSKYLSDSTDEDIALIKELNVLHKFIKNIKKSNGIPDMYWFNLRSLHQLSDLKGSYNPATLEAKEKVYNTLLSLSDAFDSLYKGQVLVVGLVCDTSHTRRIRSAEDERGETQNATDELKDNIYDPDFPVIFNIILWFTIALVFALLAVSVFIASMDPGRDSIIYRMTSNRMKKDS